MSESCPNLILFFNKFLHNYIVLKNIILLIFIYCSYLICLYIILLRKFEYGKRQKKYKLIISNIKSQSIIQCNIPYYPCSKSAGRIFRSVCYANRIVYLWLTEKNLKILEVKSSDVNSIYRYI